MEIDRCVVLQEIDPQPRTANGILELLYVQQPPGSISLHPRTVGGYGAIA
jgi:hypothetical protein